PVATIGTVLYDDKGGSFTIKKSKLRGEHSFGMICAEDELGLGTSHDGIMVLEEDLKPGMLASEVFSIDNDTIFEIGLTPNRADAMSHYGVARDIKAGMIQKGLKANLKTPLVSNFHVDERTFKINIAVDDAKLVPRYTGVTINNITVAPSPDWLQKRLKSIGLTPINNIIDITNFVMHDIGQPLHAFDASKIGGNKVLVKTLEANTPFTTLDGVDRKLHADDIMICDANDKPLCIAGVLGGIDSGISQNTTSVFLESAYFNAISIRKTAKRHQLNTDASFRFERGIDPEITEYALKRATILILELAGGKITSDIVEFYPKKIENFEVLVSYDAIYRLIGDKIPEDTIKNILASLDIKINSQTSSGLGLTVPAYRVDVQREADIVEEILRVYGFNNVKISDNVNTSIPYFDKFDSTTLENIVANQLTAQGFNETMANSLTKPGYIDLSDDLNSDYNVAILNPLSNDLSVMRQSMLFSGLEAVVYNINRKNSNIKFFEFGNTYHKFSKDYEEQKHLTLFVSGNRIQKSWNLQSKPSDFFYLKGIVNTILERLGLVNLKTTPIKNAVFSEGIVLQKGKIKLVEFGVVKNNILGKFGISTPVLFADFDWNAILKVINKNNLIVSKMPKYPAVKRDLALLIDEKVSFKEIYNVAKQTEQNLLKNIDLFDVYQGDKLPKGKKSYAVSFVLQDDNKTLEDKQIEKIMTKLQSSFSKQLQAELR
ncbi:MAG: phenylalanine--tRNA ligase subunit beta, partial [Flavobacteriaceae bacterium]